jgi:hypothetical protein
MLLREINLHIRLQQGVLFLTLLVVVSCFSVNGLLAQKPLTVDAFGKFRTELDQFKSQDKSLSLSTEKIESHFQYLQKRMSAGADTTPEYLISLRSNAELLDAAQKNPRKAPELVTAAQQDLEIKVAYARKSSSLGNVPVRIITKKSGKEVSDYFIRCNPRVDGDREPCKFPLNNPSSPTNGELPPGVLLMWAVKGDIKTAAQPKIVDGSTNPQVIILEIP